MIHNSWFQTTRQWCEVFESSWLARKDQLRFWEFSLSEFSKRDWVKDFSLDRLMIDFVHELPKLRQMNANSTFGSPPLTLFYSEKGNFVLDLYIWMDAHTAIHDHGFQGCFSVLTGKSLAATYRFEDQRGAWGKLVAESLDLLAPGDVRPISPDDKTIHRVLHLDRPTVSLALRTINEQNKIQSQYDFGCLKWNSYPPEQEVLQLRLLDWYLQQEVSIPGQLMEDLAENGLAWPKLFINKKSQKLAHKLAHMNVRPEFYQGLIRSICFNALFHEMKNHPQEQILFTSYEFFSDEHQWGKWLETHLSMTLASARERLKKVVLNSQFSQNNDISSFPLLKNLLTN